jgi:hypothetical protein
MSNYIILNDESIKLRNYKYIDEETKLPSKMVFLICDYLINYCVDHHKSYERYKSFYHGRLTKYQIKMIYKYWERLYNVKLYQTLNEIINFVIEYVYEIPLLLHGQLIKQDKISLDIQFGKTEYILISLFTRPRGYGYSFSFYLYNKVKLKEDHLSIKRNFCADVVLQEGKAILFIIGSLE